MINNIKNEMWIIIISVVILTFILFRISYSYFFTIDEGENNVISVGDLKISFCEDETCNKGYENFGQVIGTKIIDGKRVVDNIYPFVSNEEALKTNPYIFNIKNTGSLKSFLTIRLLEDKDYAISNYKSITENYSNNIRIGISECNNKIDRENVIVTTYNTLEDNIISTGKVLDKGEDVTYCLWTWLDENTPNNIDNSYFVANLEFSAEYKPN